MGLWSMTRPMNPPGSLGYTMGADPSRPVDETGYPKADKATGPLIVEEVETEGKKAA